MTIMRKYLSIALFIILLGFMSCEEKEYSVTTDIEGTLWVNNDNWGQEITFGEETFIFTTKGHESNSLHGLYMYDHPNLILTFTSGEQWVGHVESENELHIATIDESFYKE